MIQAVDLSTVAGRLFDTIAGMSPDTLGVSRPAFSTIETHVLDYLRSEAEQAGLAAWYDEGQNLVMALPEDATADRYVLVGSHVDSVPMGGNFDGLAGVVAGMLCLFRAHGEGRHFPRPVKVIAMRGEESAWFGPCYIASKCLMGVLSQAELAANHKGDGRSLQAHMHDIGIDTDRIAAGSPLMDPSQILEYLELHIEQGPLLVGKGMSAAVVSGIRGNFRHRAVKCIGEAGHSGAVPRAFRRDPVLAMADLLSRLDDSWLSILQKGDDLVLTAGVVHTDPASNAMSRIPDQVSFSLDIRSQSAHVLAEMRTLLANEVAQVAKARKVQFELGSENATPPASMAPNVVGALAGAMERLGLEPFVMASGGGHDAAVFANASVPSAMVFVRNRNGSHNPDEAMDIADFMVGASIIFEHLCHEVM